jgi:GH25 family lysozyme M1 (1,4-beta-N-acetylmuramidase)
MLRGIDISNWQRDLKLADVLALNPNIDFVIAKATEGTTYVDHYCDGFVQTSKAAGVLVGFYHFLRTENPVSQAEFFARNTEGYSGWAVPVVDIEDPIIANWGGYADRFTERYHELTGVWPLVYASAAALPRFEGHSVTRNCGLWVAGYPKSYKSFDGITEPPYETSPWKTWTIWQFTPSGRIDGYSGNLDLDFANLTPDGWARIARGDAKPTASDELTHALEVIADHVIAGEFGNGAQRKEKLYNAIQEQVNLRVVM